MKQIFQSLKNGETFSDLSAILSGSKLTTGSKTASDLVEEQAKRIKEKIEKVKTKLDEDLVDEATLKSLLEFILNVESINGTKIEHFLKIAVHEASP